MEYIKWYYKYRGNGYGGFLHPYECILDMMENFRLPPNGILSGIVLLFGNVTVKEKKLISGTNLTQTRTLMEYDLEKLDINYRIYIKELEKRNG